MILKTDQIITYQIHFCYLNGYNIRLSLLIPNEQKEFFILYLNEYFKDILQTISSNKRIKLSSNEINTIYPYGTIQYGLCEFDYNEDLLDTKYQFQKNLSDIIIEALNDESLDEETIFVFAYYLHSILINVFFSYFHTSLDVLLSTYQIDFSNQTIDIYRFYKCSKDNFNSFHNITADIFPKKTTLEKKNVDWINAWKLICYNYIKFNFYSSNQFKTTSNDEIQKAQRNLMNIINQHLTVQYSSEKLLHYLISQITNMYFADISNNNFPSFGEVKKEMRKKHLRKIQETSLFCLKTDDKPIPEGKNELRLFVIARNESLRLPYFLKYYSKLGVDRFFLSNLKYLLSHSCVFA